MQRLYSMFPAGAAGIGLLLLRFQIALQLIGGADSMNASLAMPDWMFIVLCLLSVCVGLGLLTPIVALIGAIGGVLLFGPLLAQLSLLALALLGPGAYAVDARLFGRRLVRDVKSR